ncbi:MAG: diguanylate cyclase [Peptococcaceae bacterium]|nr:diguanylate cyclase [Peptococcaceae bacterium]
MLENNYLRHNNWIKVSVAVNFAIMIGLSFYVSVISDGFLRAIFSLIPGIVFLTGLVVFSWLDKRFRWAARTFGTLDIILKGTRNAVIVFNRRGQIVACSEAVERVMGFNCARVLDTHYQPVLARYQGEDGVGLDKVLKEVMDTGRVYHDVEFVLRDDGVYRVLSVGAVSFVLGRGVAGAILIARDITGRKKLEERLSRENVLLQNMAQKDGMTGLYNYSYIMDALDKKLKDIGDAKHIALVMIDIDDFKVYNDTHGHPAGDKLLVLFSRVLENSVRGDDVVGRYGGDEFVVILEIDDLRQAWEVTSRLRRELMALEFPGSDCFPNGHLTVSIGIAAGPEDGTSVAELVKAADEALYSAKRGGKNRVCFYRPFRSKQFSVERGEDID